MVSVVSGLFVVSRRRRGVVARVVVGVLSVVGLVVGGVVCCVPSAWADDVITTQEYFSYYHLDQARAKGYTGKGVTIALIDGPVDTNAPELRGANITTKDPCPYEAAPSSRSHGTAIASILVSKNYGIAPDATLLAYASPLPEDKTTTSCTQDLQNPSNDPVDSIHAAINDGAQIISISRGRIGKEDGLKWAIARAMSQGIIVVASMGNTSSDNNDKSLAVWSGVVGVSAITSDGKLASFSSWGNGTTTAAIGDSITIRDYETGRLDSVRGTSFSTPIVAGQLALARQKWPNATTNQLLQLLVNTASNPNHEWNKYTGYGPSNGGALVNTDPSQYPDENPLAQKEGGSSPTVQEVQDYADGLVDAFEARLDASYRYRGVDETSLDLSGSGEKAPAHLGTSPRYHRKKQ